MKLDFSVLLLRFLVGFLLWSILFLLLLFVLPVKLSVFVPFIVGLLTMIWGDRFVVATLKLLANWPAS